MRLLLRIVSVFSLVAAVLLGVFDAIASVAGSGVILTSLRQISTRFAPELLAAAENATASLPGGGWMSPAFAWVLAQPACGVLLSLFLLAWVGGFRRQPAAGRFAA